MKTRRPRLFDDVIRALLKMEQARLQASKKRITEEVEKSRILNFKCLPCNLNAKITEVIKYGVMQGIIKDNHGKIKLTVGPRVLKKLTSSHSTEVKKKRNMEKVKNNKTKHLIKCSPKSCNCKLSKGAINLYARSGELEARWLTTNKILEENNLHKFKDENEGEFDESEGNEQNQYDTDDQEGEQEISIKDFPEDDEPQDNSLDAENIVSDEDIAQSYNDTNNNNSILANRCSKLNKQQSIQILMQRGKKRARQASPSEEDIPKKRQISVADLGMYNVP